MRLTWMLTLVCLMPANPAVAALIVTAPLREVCAHSSHVALVKWLPEKKCFRVERPFRGAWPDVEFRVHGVPRFVRAAYEGRLHQEVSIDWPWTNRPKERVSPRMILFAQAVDGRMYLTGPGRYGKSFGPHASVRILTEEGSVFRFQQVMNPGQPVPCRAEGANLEEFEKVLGKMLEQNPFQPQPAPRPPIAQEHRDAFFGAIGDTFDWYQGCPYQDLAGWGVTRTPLPVLEATADRLEAWMDSVPKEQRIHGLDGMMVLCRKVQGGGADTRAIQRRIHARLDQVDRSQAEAWIVRELRYGDYYVNRRAIGRIAQLLGPDVWIKARNELEAWIERAGFNEGSASWRALVYLGDRERAEAAVKRREAREAAEEKSK